VGGTDNAVAGTQVESFVVDIGMVVVVVVGTAVVVVAGTAVVVVAGTAAVVVVGIAVAVVVGTVVVVWGVCIPVDCSWRVDQCSLA
jgi:hypothetical protein